MEPRPKTVEHLKLEV